MVLSSGNLIVRISYKVLGKHVARYVPLVKKFREVYKKSGIFVPYEVYVSFWAFVITVSTASTFTALLVARYLYNIAFNIYLLFIVPLTVFGVTTSLSMVYPLLLKTYVRGKIEGHLFQTTNLLYVISSAGLTFEKMLSEASNVTEETYTRRYLDRIVRNIEVFGMGVDEALNETVERIPSSRLTSILNGIVYALKTTGNPLNYLKLEIDKLRSEKRRELEKKVSSLVFFGEIYVALLVVSPVIFILVLSTLSILGGAFMGLPVVAWLNIIVFILIPALATFLAVFLDMLAGG